MEFINQPPIWSIPIILVLAIWTLFWKAMSLWKSARAGHRVWFVIFMIVNTAGILEILYLFVFTRTKKHELLSKD
jgi:Family of unknown function (DUF5652)